MTIDFINTAHAQYITLPTDLASGTVSQANGTIAGMSPFFEVLVGILTALVIFAFIIDALHPHK